ncbi:hypothetical protein [Erythrobacter westpacificensis]|uniref:hypothetical protein n=1 Tax=Erythrobacter westpacificensis TaxID=1055231 RepID=UPI0031F8B810
MASTSMSKRVAALEGARGVFRGPAIWVLRQAGETTAEAIARYEAEHGPRLPGQLVIIWQPVSPRPEQCAA